MQLNCLNCVDILVNFDTKTLWVINNILEYLLDLKSRYK